MTNAAHVVHTDRTAARGVTITADTSYIDGTFRFLDADLARMASAHGNTAAWIAAFDRFGAAAPNHVTGDFAVAVRDTNGRVHLAVDRFAIRTLCYRIARDGVAVHERADALAEHGTQHDVQAIFDYLYLHVIAAPRTIFSGVNRLPAGYHASVDAGEARVTRWWAPQFTTSGDTSLAQLEDEFRTLVSDAVALHAESPNVACFLSGGTDSSTVAGMLTKVTGTPAPTYSIGFDAQGYDELEYARIAARHFGTNQHEYYVTPDDLVTGIPRIAAAFDQPFGNSSVVPTYYCARIAHDDGMTRILGGDGGDELFGGNTRYAKQRLFEAYAYMPSLVRSGIIEPLLSGRLPLHKMRGLGKIASYVEQARVPMPQRMMMYNLLTRLGIGSVLTDEFLLQVDADAPLRALRECYAAAGAPDLVNRMLAYDWRYTLAENDLPKVRGAAAVAGIDVAFPLLDDAIVDFSLRLRPSLKVKGLELRWFFKRALSNFLPPEILSKKKHGFGLPFGVWLTKDAALRDLAATSLAAFARRGIVREAFIERLLRELVPSHPGYYGEMVWILMMLEQWLGRPGQTRNAVPPQANKAGIA